MFIWGRRSMKISRNGLLVLMVILAVTCYAVGTGSEELVLTPGGDGVQRATVLVDSHFYKPKDIVVRVGYRLS
jgi:hypothetical protein